MGEEKKSLDVLGIKPLSDAALVVVQGVVDGAGAFLGRICLPAAEELGLLLKDKVSAWRARNAAAISLEAKKILETEGKEDVHAHPRIVGKIIEEGSWEDDPDLQKLWAGLLASSCSQDGRDQSNLIFINLLKQMTSSEVKLVNYACERSKKKLTGNGLIVADGDFAISTEEVQNILGTSDIHQADVEMDHLREIGILSTYSGFRYEHGPADITPSALALHLYVRCQGKSLSPIEFYGLSEATATPANSIVPVTDP
ncbi:MAG TPA: Abi-alpha family protein [Croceibacterium sp.]|nr:Abi-alpha family protein [Propylenella sp.]HYD24351.1 Abi-alpha family protein [Croceibacterium sp.]